MAACVAGAAFFAAQHPAPRDAYKAAGTIVIPIKGEATAGATARTLQAAELLRQPYVVSEALARAQQGSEPEGVLRELDVGAKPSAGIVGFSVRAATAATAGNLAEALGRVVVGLLQLGQATGDRFGLRIVGDFEVDAEGWGATGPEDGVGLVGVFPNGRYGGSSLRALCETAEGCGAARVIEGRFPKGRPVTVTAWIRGRRPSRVLLVLGDVTGRALRDTRADVGDEWRRFAVVWTPERNERRISLQVVNGGAGPSDVMIDGVLLVTGSDAVTEGRESRIFAERGYAYTSPIRIVGSRTGSTLEWALIGAGVGLLVGLAGLGAAMLARRRALRSVSR
jgi:hypothetical protein